MNPASPIAPESRVRRYRMIIAYDGTNYCGWQVQPKRPTVQRAIESVLELVTRHPCKVHGSGRTDQGVHAIGQVAHVDLVTRLPGLTLMRALNARLSPDIRIESMTRTRPDFHARREALAKEYRYFVWNDAIMPPHRRLYALHIRRALDLERMRRAGQAFVGRHEFKAFMANPNRPVDNSVRTIGAVRILKRRHELCFVFRGDGFLYKQVRSMTGLLLRIGGGQEPEDLVERLLASPSPRTARVPSSPPQGLFLWRVWYPRREAGRCGAKRRTQKSEV